MRSYLSIWRRIMALTVLGAMAALAASPVAAQSSDRQQRDAGGDAFYNRGTGGVPPP